MSNKIALEALKSELRESAITTAKLVNTILRLAARTLAGLILYALGPARKLFTPTGCPSPHLQRTDMNKATFARCPFCGKSDTLTIGKASDAFSELDDCGDPLPYMHTESYSVVCDSSKPDGPGGCGASGGYFPSEHEAVAAWNRRAEVERLAAQAEPAPAPVGEYPAKALEGVGPVACLVETEQGVMVWPIADLGEASTYCDEGEFPELLYPAAAVSALQARIAELESELRRVTTSPPTGSAPCARLCEHMAFQIQAKSDARRIAELEQDAVRGEPVITDQDMKGVCDEVAKK